MDEGAGGVSGLSVRMVGLSGDVVESVAYQNAPPYSFRSSSLEWFLTVVKALPVAFLWYVFLDGSPPWLVSVILDRMVTLVIREDGVWNEERVEQNVVLGMTEGRVRGYGKRQGNVRESLQKGFMNNVGHLQPV